MRLLLDEHFSPEVARSLRERGHDVMSVGRDADLAGMDDETLLRAAHRMGRAIVTEDVADFLSITRELTASGAKHAGIVITNPKTFSRSHAGIGRLANALHGLLITHPTDDALTDQVVWLTEAPA